ncbi:hypothetical protein TNCV_4111711 [Trichonephila clavipes]|nr:hypothetical protein TNCV_4111711 [Trichonephila clavipes]
MVQTLRLGTGHHLLKRSTSEAQTQKNKRRKERKSVVEKCEVGTNCSAHALAPAAPPTGKSVGGEDSLPDSKLVLAENMSGVRDFRFTFYKWYNDSRLRDEQQLLYLPRPSFLDQHHVW